MILLLLCSLIIIHYVQLSSTYSFSVYGDVYKDKEFFVSTFPWIIDNIGGDVSVNFYMQGSGRYTVPQMCTLDQLSSNTFLQAQFLKCEAEEQPSEVCLCESGVDPERFRDCVRNGGSLAAESTATFYQLGIDVTPLVELGPKSTVFGVKDAWFLKKICTIFGDNLPRGCIKPFSCNGTEVFKSRNAISQFDRRCIDAECRKPQEMTTTVSPTSTVVPTTEAWYNLEYTKYA